MAGVIAGVLLSACGSATGPSAVPSQPSAADTASATPSATPTSGSSSPSASPSATRQFTRDECAQVWSDYQHGDIAPGFPTVTSLDEVDDLQAQCEDAGLLPSYDEQLTLTQRAFSTTAQILEKQIAKVSRKTGKPPCEVILDVIKPVGAQGRPLGPGDDVEGYSPDSFLPILRYNWYGGPFRLKFGVGCGEYPHANLWLFADPYPPEDSHPARFPTDDDVKKDPWPRAPFEGPMSTCITWGPELGNDGVGGRGFIFEFAWDQTNLPNDVKSCYPRALGLEGLDEYPFEVVPNLP